MDEQQNARRPLRSAVGWSLASTLAVTAVLGAVSSPARATVEPSAPICFSVEGEPRGAAIVNLTPVAPTAGGNGQLISSNIKNNPPTASNVNFVPGPADPNVAIAEIGNDNQVCYQNSTHATHHLVADHLGTIANNAYTPARPDGAPDRRVNTRQSLGGDIIPPSGQLCFTVTGNPGDAAIVNLTPVAPTAGGNGQLISSNIKNNPPTASNVNFVPGPADPNVAIAEIGNDNQVCYQNSTHATHHLVADHLGTIADSAYTPARPDGAPDRRVNTRQSLGGDIIPPSGQLCFTVTGNPGDAAIVNLTPVAPTAGGNGQLISSNIKNNPPTASNVNFVPGPADPNVAIAEIGNDNQVCYQNSTHATHHLVADHLGTIADSAYTPARPDGAPDRRVNTRQSLIKTDLVPRECLISPTTDYITSTSRHMFGLSSRAYEIEPGEATLLDRLDTIGDATVHFPDQMNCWELVTVFRGGGGAAGLLSDTEVIVARNVHTFDLAVAFRGTELNAIDILNDLSATRVPYGLPDGRIENQAVHSGFLVAYSGAKQQLTNVLRAHERAEVRGARVFFTGHSLGGALATIAALDLHDELMSFGYTRDEIVTYTYGAPRSMSERLSDIRHSLLPVTYAVAHPKDLVSHTPTPIDTFPNPYSHVRNMVVLNAERNSFVVRPNAGDGRDYRACPPPMWVPDLALLYHSRNQYVQWLEAGRAPAPTVSVARIDVSFPFIDDLQMRWSTPVEGPCDQVALYDRTTRPTSVSGAKRDIYVDFPGRFSSFNPFPSINVDDANWIAYIDIFGKVIAARQFDLEP